MAIIIIATTVTANGFRGRGSFPIAPPRRRIQAGLRHCFPERDQQKWTPVLRPIAL
jgi:hypothetical protein